MLLFVASALAEFWVFHNPKCSALVNISFFMGRIIASFGLGLF